MRNKISQQNIERLISELSPTRTDAGAHALENSQKTSWNKISHIIDTLPTHNMTNNLENTQKRSNNFFFRKKYLWLALPALFLAVTTGLIYSATKEIIDYIKSGNTEKPAFYTQEEWDTLLAVYGPKVK